MSNEHGSALAVGLPPLEPTTQKFIDDLNAAGGKPLYQLGPAAAHQVLTDLQSQPVRLLPVDIEDTTFPVGPTGTTRIRIVRPKGSTGVLPVVMYFHGGGWVLGDKVTHDRLVREIAVGVDAAVVFVDYINSPEAKYPTPNEQSYAAMNYVVEHAKELKMDASRLCIVGDSVGGNITAAVTLMAKARGGPKISYQVLLYPVVEYMSNAKSMQDYADGPWLTAKTMKWMFDLYGLDGTQTEITAYPLRATMDQLKGLPDALFIFDDDILRDDGEAYAAKLSQAVERVRAAREAIDRTGTGVLLVARAECYHVGHPDPLRESIRRLQAYAMAGADVLFAPGPQAPEAIQALVEAVRPKPLNLLVVRDIGLSVDDIAALGVRRISVGGALALAGWTAFIRAAHALKSNGSFSGLADLVPYSEINSFLETDLPSRRARGISSPALSAQGGSR